MMETSRDLTSLARGLAQSPRLRPVTVKPPRLPAAALRLWQAAAARDVSGQVPAFGHDIGYRLAAPDVAGRIGTRLGLTIDGAPLTIHLAEDMIEVLMDAGGDPAVLGALDPARLALAAEHLLTAEIEALETSWDCRIELLSVELDQAPTADQLAAPALEVTRGSGDPVRLWPGTGAVVERMVAAHPLRPGRDRRAMKVKVTALGPIARVPRGTVRGLRPGDVFLPAPQWTTVAEGAHLLVADRHLVPARPVEGGLVADGAEDDLKAIVNRGSGGMDMTDDEMQGGPSAADPAMTVTVELEWREMTVSEIEGLQAGQVVPLTLQKVETVVLCADGAPVASGRLVQLDDRLGVQIVKLV